MVRLGVAAVLLLTLLSGAAGAVGKVTVDPNTPDKVVPADARVEQKVTCAARKQFVCQILADLSAQTGVTLNAGFNDQDWQVRDRRMTILVKDVTLHELMDSIARTMKFLWKTEGNPAKPAYRLYMDRHAVLLYEAARKRAADRIASLRARCRRNLLDSISRGASLSDREVADLKASDPYGYALARSGAAAGLTDLFAAYPEARAAIEDGRSERFNDSSRLSGNAAAAASKALTGLSKMDKGGMDPAYANSVPQEVLDISINDSIDDDGEIIQIGFSYGVGKDNLESRFFYLRDPASDKAVIEGERTAALWEAKPEDSREVNILFDKRMQSAEVPDWVRSTDDSSEPLAKHTADPELDRPIDLTLKKDKEYSYGDFEDLIAEKCELNVVAETYVGELPTGSFGDPKVETVGKLLGLLEDATGSNWWKHGSIIEVRSRYWYEARGWQVPEAWLEQWRQTFKTTGTLDIDDLAAISSLTWDQVLDNVLADPLLMNGQGRKSDLSEVLTGLETELQIYAKLTARQRARLFTKRGLDLLSIPNLLPQPSSGSSWSVPEAITQVLVTGKRQRKGKAWDYQFSITIDADDGTEVTKPLTFTTPLYIEPKKGESTPSK